MSPSARGQLRPSPTALAKAPAELLDELRADPYTYFRFINRAWITRACEAFADVRDVPTVRLHGDAHLEQFAVTKDAWGLDDFDDSARGPQFIDLVRFMGSLDLATRRREWTRDRDAVWNRFLEGYRRGLSDPAYRSPEPDIVRQLRARAPVPRDAYLAWGESKMQPLDDATSQSVVAGMDAFERFLRRERPELAPGYFSVIRAGWLRMGVGSAVLKKVLIRVQGPTAAPDDDVLIEAKEAVNLEGLECLEHSISSPAIRVIDGTRQLARVNHAILAVGPRLMIPSAANRAEHWLEWWVSSWEPSYTELEIGDLRSVQDLAAVAFDAGVQLGAGGLAHDASVRARALSSIDSLEGRLRKDTSELVDDLVAGWQELGARQDAGASQAPPKPGRNYTSLSPRRQRLVDDWVRRFNMLTRRNLQAGVFYDSEIKLSTKTTFDAITYALERSPLTDGSGQALGDALDLVERLESTRGEVIGAAGDRQFRMYVILTTNALDTLERSQQFNRGVDNTVYHKGYPINYRQQGGLPSIQISVAADKRRADIDVDYRASWFPGALFNGHLTASNSDVRSGNNYDRHTNKWTGFQNWWRSVFGIGIDRTPAARNDAAGLIPSVPRVGDKSIEVMVEDFLEAWLVDGDIPAAMGYVAERAYACVVEDDDDPFSADRGIAPFVLAGRLDAARHALGPRTSLNGVTIGVRLPNSALRVVKQPHHAQFVISAVPDDFAAQFDCESPLTPGDPREIRRRYGNYFGATFYVKGPRGMDHSIALLWGKNEGYWKIVSWKSDPMGEDIPAPETTPAVKAARMTADPALVTAARDFLESWLIRKDYDAAFRYFSPKSYPCYDRFRPPDAPASTSVADAGQKLRASLERAGTLVGSHKTLDEVLEGPTPVHPAIRVVDHPDGGAFTLGGLPDAFAGTIDCSAPANRERRWAEGAAALDYGRAFGMAVRVRTRSGETPVIRMLWLRDADAWRITAYDVETP